MSGSGMQLPGDAPPRVPAEAPSAWKLTRVIALAQATLDSLRTEHGQIIETDAEAMEALLAEGVDVAGLIRGMVRAAQEAEANAEALVPRISALNARKARFAKQEERWRDTILAALNALEMKKYPHPEFSITWNAGKGKLVISSPDDLPLDLVEVETVRKPLTAEIKAKLLAGEDVAGACLSNPQPYITIKAR